MVRDGSKLSVVGQVSTAQPPNPVAINPEAGVWLGGHQHSSPPNDLQGQSAHCFGASNGIEEW